ncbi:MAG TPA: type II secretion system protein GspL [Caldimonas sp.]|jgi:general secretion pathway protein L|nr:type II secretion system protein GspL [Caldimonas sp.]HEX4233336.1 type II secretion system protein GspL [Caldimonas sp.]
MSTLVLQLPERRRLRAGAADEPGSAAARRREYAYATSDDGIELDAHGQAAAALLPSRSVVIAVVPEADVSWHRIALPKAPASRLRAALVGVLEEELLDDADAVHLAIAPLAAAGQPTWVAAVDKAWLQGELAALEKAHVFVDRVVPMAWPDDPPAGHFHAPAEGVGSVESALLTWASVDGVATLRLDGGLARALVPQPAPPTTRWTASPMAATAAEHWLGAPVNVMPTEHRLLQAGRSLWNLRQFDLARRTRGARAIADWGRQLMSPAWRPVRIGAALLVAAQIVGLNVWAWHERSVVESRRAAIQALVKKTFPRAADADIQRDPAAVMLREAQALRTLAGKAGDGDLEPMLQAAAAAWPGERPPVENLRYEPGKLTLSAVGWSDKQIEQFRSILRPAGVRVDASEGRLVLTRARGGATLG